jgi:asparagine synthase (glutamine-hydrolysing)
MSAIFGVLHLDGASAREKHLQKMQNTIGHYGTDARDILLDQNIGLGCCLNKPGRYYQADIPVYRDELRGRILVGDALIYNREEIMAACLPGDKKEISTQALLMEAYLKWGEDCPKYLNGDFAFAIWDRKQKRLLLFRDHLGVRPLYYFYDRSVFAFATDYRALLALPFVGKQLDEILLYAALSNTYHIDTQSTYFAQIKRLPQAHALRVGGQGIVLKKYWSPGAGPKIIRRSEEQYAKELYSLVNDAVKLRLEHAADQIGSEFSGGLDSSVVTILAHRELKKTGRELQTYSWSPSFDLLGKLETDERELINAVSSHEGFPCSYRSSYITPEQASADPPALTDGQRSEELRQVLWEMSSQGITAVLSGWGGDEGISHRADLPELLLSGYAWHFLKEARYLAKGSPLRFFKLLLSIPVVLLWRPYSFFGTQNNKIPEIMRKEFAKAMKKHCKKDILYLKVNPAKHIESGVSVSRTELAAWLGADYRIQYLFPFLDRRVVDYALSIPRHLYYKQGLSRYIYRKAFDHILPKELCYNVSKIDIAREKYWKETEDIRRKSEIVMSRINKDMFAFCIDWHKLEKLSDQGYFQQNARESIFTLIKIQICYDLQRILEKAQEDR